MHIFYTPNIINEIYVLAEEESKHAVRVLRLKNNDIIYLIDGRGGFYTAKIIDAAAKKCIVEVIDTKTEVGKKDFYLHIAIAPTKNIERIEWCLEKLTEVGIDEISTLKCHHSERTIVKNERLEKIIITAIKQSIKAYCPKLNEIKNFKEFVQQRFIGRKFIAHCGDGMKQNLKDIYKKTESALILIGPEGDFSAEEIMFAIKNNFEPINLGNSRLRTETAAIIACHSIHFLNN